MSAREEEEGTSRTVWIVWGLVVVNNLGQLAPSSCHHHPAHILRRLLVVDCCPPWILLWNAFPRRLKEPTLDLEKSRYASETGYLIRDIIHAMCLMVLL